MTHRDYARLAAALAPVLGPEERDPAIRLGAKLAAIAVADALQEGYSNFNRRRFLDACGLEYVQ